MGNSPWGHKESDITEATKHACLQVEGLCFVLSCVNGEPQQGFLTYLKITVTALLRKDYTVHTREPSQKAILLT